MIDLLLAWQLGLELHLQPSSFRRLQSNHLILLIGLHALASLIHIHSLALDLYRQSASVRSLRIPVVLLRG
jgi:hypothetical protein